MTRTLATSPDGLWAAARDGRMLSLLPATGGAPLGTIELDSEDVDVALVGPPASLVIVARDGVRAQVTLYQPPQLEPAPAVQPKQCAAVATRRPASAAASNSAIVRGRERSTPISSIWLKSQSNRRPVQSTLTSERHMSPSTAAGLKAFTSFSRYCSSFPERRRSSRKRRIGMFVIV